MILTGANVQFDPKEGFILPACLGEGLGCTLEPGEVQEPLRGALPIILVRTHVQIIVLPLGGRRGD
jgi:hypothetical protein